MTEKSTPLTVGKLREVIKHLPDDAVIDICTPIMDGYVHYASINVDFSGKLLLVLFADEA